MPSKGAVSGRAAIFYALATVGSGLTAVWNVMSGMCFKYYEDGDGAMKQDWP